MRAIISVLLMGWALMGCATSATSPRACLDGRRQVRQFIVENLRSVVVEMSSNRRYRVHLAVECPSLGTAQQVSFANGLPVIIDYHSDGRGAIWAETLYGSARICGLPGDRLVIRDRTSYGAIEWPRPSCAIMRVENLQTPHE